MKLGIRIAALFGATALVAVSESAWAQTWTVTNDYVPTGGPTTVGAAGSTTGVGGGWIDVNGSIWSLNSSNQALPSGQAAGGSPWNANQLVRPSTEAAQDGRQRAKFTAVAPGSAAPTLWLYFKYNGTAGSGNGFIAAVGMGGAAGRYLQTGHVVSGAVTTTASTTAYTLTAGTTYILDAQAVQTNSTTVTVTLTLYAADGVTVIATYSNTDTTASLQNISGVDGLFEFWTAGTNMELIQELITYNDNAAATAYTLTGPPSGTSGAPSSPFTVTASGNLSSSVIVTPSDGGGGGTFSSTTVTLAAGTNPSGTFTYTPASTGAKTISTTNNGGLTNPSALTYTSNSNITIPVNSAAFLFSPATWKGDTGRGGSVYRQSWNNGAWFTVTWNASASPTATLLLPSTSTTNKLSYVLNNGSLVDNVAATGNISVTPVPSSTNTLTVYLRNSTQSARWAQTGTGNTVQIDGLQVDGASSAGTAPAAKPWVLVIGDSITEGILAAGSSTDDNLYDYSYLLGQALESVGYDYAISACGYSGWIRPGDSTGDVPGYYVVTSGAYSEMTSRWDKVDSGVSLLDAVGQISSYGSTGTAPAAIIVNYGENEALSSSSVSDTTQSVTQGLQALRAAAPSAQILMLMPFGLEYTGSHSTYPTYLAALRAGFAAYQAASPGDAKIKLVDLGAPVAARLFTSGSQYTSDSALVHPNYLGHALVAPQIMTALDRSLGITGFTTNCYARTGGFTINYGGSGYGLPPC